MCDFSIAGLLWMFSSEIKLLVRGTQNKCLNNSANIFQ